MAISPTQRTLKRMKESGKYAVVQVVEKWNPFARIRQDLWNFDILGVSKDGELHFIQVTTKGNMKARENKIADSEYTPHLRNANLTLLVEGWAKVEGRWKSFITDVS
jgi:hypothetical protein